MTLSLINKIKLWKLERRFLSLHKRMKKNFKEQKINRIKSSWQEESTANPFSNESILTEREQIKKSIDDELFSELIELIELADKPANKLLVRKVPSDFVYEMM